MEEGGGGVTALWMGKEVGREWVLPNHLLVRVHIVLVPFAHEVLVIERLAEVLVSGTHSINVAVRVVLHQ